MIGLHVRYDCHGVSCKDRISKFCFEGENWLEAHEEDAGEGRIYLLKCKCGSNDWHDNGRHVNEFECNSCGQFVELSWHQESVTSKEEHS